MMNRLKRLATVVALTGFAAVVNGCVPYSQTTHNNLRVYNPQEIGVPLTDEEMEQIREDPCQSEDSTDLVRRYACMPDNRRALNRNIPRK